MRVTDPKTGAVLDPSEYEIRVGLWIGDGKTDPVTGEYVPPPFRVSEVFDGTMTGPPTDESEIDQLLEFVRARRRPDILIPLISRDRILADSS